MVAPHGFRLAVTRRIDRWRMGAVALIVELPLPIGSVGGQANVGQAAPAAFDQAPQQVSILGTPCAEEKIRLEAGLRFVPDNVPILQPGGASTLSPAQHQRGDTRASAGAAFHHWGKRGRLRGARRASACERFGKLDVLVNNAALRQSLFSTSSESTTGRR